MLIPPVPAALRCSLPAVNYLAVILPSSVSTFTPATVTSSGIWTVTPPNLDLFRDINRGFTFYRHA